MTAPATDAPLTGIGVLVTRPPEQSGPLIEKLRTLGAEPVVFPALTILPPRDPDALRAILQRLGSYDLAIFISPSAARMGLSAARAIGPWPGGPAVAAVGPGTAKTLSELGFETVLHPSKGSDSEHLLAHLAGHPDWRDMAGKRILILRGETGRETLAEALRAQGALVDHAPCYRRGLPELADAAPVLSGFRSGTLRAVTAYSGETLDNLFQLLGPAGAESLRAAPLFVPHPRIAEHAQSKGIRQVMAFSGGDEGLLSGLVEYFRHD